MLPAWLASWRASACPSTPARRAGGATGGCWRAMAESIPGFAAVPESSVVLAGVRDTAPLEQERLDASDIMVVPPGAPLAAALDALAGRCEVVYLHVDVDVLDPSVAPM